MRSVAWWAMVTVLTACESTPALLQVELLPTVGNKAAVVIFATTGKGTVGTGDVELTTSAGTLADATVALDGSGSAKTTLTCDAASGCSGAVTVRARWRSPGGMVQATDVIDFQRPDAGDGGDAGGTRVSNECQGLARPGANLACCGGSGSPPCPAVLVAPGTTVIIPFHNPEDGGSRVDVRVTWVAPATATTSLDDCRASRPRLEDDSGNGVVYSCDDFMVGPSGEWRPLSSGGCQIPSNFIELVACTDLYGPGQDGGTWVHTLTAARVGGLVQANSDTYVFVLR